jgi:hypothetical protein
MKIHPWHKADIWAISINRWVVTFTLESGTHSDAYPPQGRK